MRLRARALIPDINNDVGFYCDTWVLHNSRGTGGHVAFYTFPVLKVLDCLIVGRVQQIGLNSLHLAYLANITITTKNIGIGLEIEISAIAPGSPLEKRILGMIGGCFCFFVFLSLQAQGGPTYSALAQGL